SNKKTRGRGRGRKRKVRIVRCSDRYIMYQRDPDLEDPDYSPPRGSAKPPAPSSSSSSSASDAHKCHLTIKTTKTADQVFSSCQCRDKHECETTPLLLTERKTG